jgi:hypothetical protein
VASAQVEYVGFDARGTAREYTLRARATPGADAVQFTLVIPHEAFVAGRVRYQDAPEICFLKLHRELLGCATGLPPTRLVVTDADLADYRKAHTPPQRGLKAPVS